MSDRKPSNIWGPPSKNLHPPSLPTPKRKGISDDVRNAQSTPHTPTDRAARQSRIQQDLKARQAQTHQDEISHLADLRETFENARSFEDDDLYFCAAGQTTEHDIAEAVEMEKILAARLKAEETKKEAERARKSYRKSFYSRNYASPARDPKSSGNVFVNATAGQEIPRIHYDEAYITLDDVPVAQGNFEGLGVFNAGHKAKTGTRASGRSSSGERSLDPTAYTFKPNVD